MPRPKKVLEVDPEANETITNAPHEEYDPLLAVQALRRAHQVVEGMNLSNWATHSELIKQSLLIPIDYAIDTIGSLVDDGK